MLIRHNRGLGLAVAAAGLAVLLAGFWPESLGQARAALQAPPSATPEAHRAALRKAVMESPDSGSAEEGRKLFFNPQLLSCLDCHRVNGQGSRSGPDLSSVGARASLEYLVDSVLYPSREIVPGYQRVRVTTTDGRTVSGVLKGQTEQYVEVKAGGRLVRVEKTEIQSLRLDPVSDMPDGVVDHLTAVQFADLIAYLRSLKGPQDVAGSR
jgi:putative heme-binding domain-containing protein